jgi:hypothetical protein
MKNKIKIKQKAGGIISYICPINNSDITIHDNITIDAELTEMDILKYFISNSDIYLIQFGASGFIFECNYNKDKDPSTSPYTSFRIDALGKKITKIIIKLSIVCAVYPSNMDDLSFDFKGHRKTVFGYSFKQRRPRCILDIDLHNEIEQFKNIVSATNSFLQTISPTIIASSVEEVDYQANSLLDYFVRRIPKMDNAHTRTAFNQIIKVARDRHESLGTRIGFIAMESVSIDVGYNTIGTFLRDHDDQVTKDRLYALGIFNILVLAEFGFIHGDHHLYNILIGHHKNYCGYFNSEDDYVSWANNMTCCFVDFGRSFSIPMLSKLKYKKYVKHFKELQLNIKEFKESHDPTDRFDFIKKCLEMIYELGYFHEGKMHAFDESWSKYRWILNIDQNISNLVYELFRANQSAQTKTYSELSRYIERLHQLQHTGQIEISIADWSPLFLKNLLSLYYEKNPNRIKEVAESSPEDEYYKYIDTISAEEKKKKESTFHFVFNVLFAFIVLVISWYVNSRTRELIGESGNRKLIGGGEQEEINAKIILIRDAFITYTNGLLSISNLQEKLKDNEFAKKLKDNEFAKKTPLIDFTKMYPEPKYDVDTGFNFKMTQGVFGGKYKTKKNKYYNKKLKKKKLKKTKKEKAKKEKLTN